MGLARGFAALAIGASLVTGPVAVCAGWEPTPEARMACCEDETQCPMHSGSDGHHSHISRTSQADADACCAASERHDSTRPRAATIASSLTAIAPVIVSQMFHAVVPSADRPHTNLPLRASPVPKHVLLSVFLV